MLGLLQFGQKVEKLDNTPTGTLRAEHLHKEKKCGLPAMLIKNAVLVTLQVLVTTIHCQLRHYQIYMVKHSLKVFQARKWLCFDRLNKLVTESLKLYCTEICFVFQICHFRLSRPLCKIQVTRSDLCVQANACYAVCCFSLSPQWM